MKSYRSPPRRPAGLLYRYVFLLFTCSIGVKRRDFVGFTGFVGNSLLAGCLDWGGTESAETNTAPAHAVEENFRAYRTSDAETYRDTIHSNSTIRDRWGEDRWDNFGPAKETSISLETAKTVERKETKAAVFLVTHTDESEPFRTRTIVDLRKEDGDWKIFEFRSIDNQPVEEVNEEATEPIRSNAEPADVVEKCFRAIFTEDVETFRETTHSEGPFRNNWEDRNWSEPGSGLGSAASIEVAETARITGTDATVYLVVIIDGSEGETIRSRNSVDLRTDDGEWKLWERIFINTEQIDENE